MSMIAYQPPEPTQALIDELREATREAHAAIKDLRRTEKAVRDLIDTEAQTLFQAVVDDAVKQGLGELGGTFRQAQDEAFDRVGAAFEELAAIYIEGSRSNGASLPELAERRRGAIRAIRERGPR